jgi:hypothetical protein
MRQAHGVLTAAVIVLAIAVPARAQTGVAETQTVRLTRGSISGIVSDDQGGPLAGAMISALGQTMSSALSDRGGRFTIDGLPAGEYLVQAHLPGFSGSRRQVVRVGGGVTPLERPLQLRPLALAVATSGASTPVAARPIMAAGVRLPAGTLSDQPDAPEASAAGERDHSHTETAWRLRHIKRGILKDASPATTLVETDEEIPVQEGWAFGRAAGLASAIFADLPISGEVNLLTSSVLAPGHFFSGDIVPRPVAYVSIGAPTPAGDWSLRAAMSQGDLSSWLVAGAFESHRRGGHAYRTGLSYSAQEYVGGHPIALAAGPDDSRNAGEVYAFDRWTVSPLVALEYGGRFARYDYLGNRGLFSPMMGVTFRPTKNTRVITTMGQQMLAPGAEEFVASHTPGPWLPPERTFSPLGATVDSMGDFRVEQARYLDLLVEHEFGQTYVLGLRRFYQDVENQLVALFDLDLPRPHSAAHYYVASAGAFTADGWAFRVSSPPSKPVRASIDYSVTRAQWISRGDSADIARWVPAAFRAEQENLHDVTTSFEGEIPETATRVFFVYRINTGYTRANHDLARPGLDARFELQINQALPFGVAGTRWEILVGVRNLFRDSLTAGSIYDELLVIRPPKRVVGGFLVRF